MGQWFYKTPEIHYDQVNHLGRPFFYYAYGAAVSEVAIDTLTGEMQYYVPTFCMTSGGQLTLQLILDKLKAGLCKGWGGSRQKSCIGSRRATRRPFVYPCTFNLQNPDQCGHSSYF